MKEHSKTAWDIASHYSGVLASETRDLAAQIDRALGQLWQPIETAPTGGEMFIYYQNRAGQRMVGLAYCAKGGGWRDSEGHWSERLDPSHWIPLPAPPGNPSPHHNFDDRANPDPISG